MRRDWQLKGILYGQKFVFETKFEIRKIQPPIFIEIQRIFNSMEVKFWILAMWGWNSKFQFYRIMGSSFGYNSSEICLISLKIMGWAIICLKVPISLLTCRKFIFFILSVRFYTQNYRDRALLRHTLKLSNNCQLTCCQPLLLSSLNTIYHHHQKFNNIFVYYSATTKQIITNFSLHCIGLHFNFHFNFM